MTTDLAIVILRGLMLSACLCWCYLIPPPPRGRLP